MVEKNKSAKIQNNLHLIDFPKQNQHIFFVNDTKEIKSKDFEVKEDEEDENLT